MKKIILFVAFQFISTEALACGDTASYRAMEVASLVILGLFVLSALLLPASFMLANRNTTLRNVLALYGLVITGLVISTVLFIINGHPYMQPVSLILFAASLFVPIVYVFLQSIKIFKQRSENA